MNKIMDISLCWVLLACLSSCLGDPLCSLSYCFCDEDSGIVECKGDAGDDIVLSSSSFSSSITSLLVSDFNNVFIKTNTFLNQDYLTSLTFQKINKMKLSKFIFSSDEFDGFVETFQLEDIKDLEIEEETFDNAPQCNTAIFKSVKISKVPSHGVKLYADTMRIEESEFGELNKESIYSDSMNFIFLGNTVGHIRTYGFSGSNNVFNFSNNYIEKIDGNAISVAFLTGDISGNTFKSHSGTPLRDIGPEPVCMPEYSSYEEDAVVEYKKVATPSFTFKLNKFPNFDLSVLNMPGTNNVPLGQMEIRDNSVPCECQLIKDLASIADFEHLELTKEIVFHDSRYGDLMFKKLFYSSSVCYDSFGKEWRLKRFSRENLEVVTSGSETFLSCTE